MQSCLDDYDSDINDINNSLPVNAALATVITPSEIPGEAIIESDNEGKAYVMNPQMLTYYEANNEGQRIFYTYTKTDNSNGGSNNKGPYVTLKTLYKILTKPMDKLAEGEEDIYGQDGINFISSNYGKTHLTLSFQILGSNSNIKHRISLVAAADAKPDANGYISVELRHNAEGDSQTSVSPVSYVSFPLSSVPGFAEGTLKGFKITMNTIYDGIDIVTINSENNKSKSFQFTWEDLYNTKIK